MKYIVIDGNIIETRQEFNSIGELRNWAKVMLNEYFEAYSEYGNPINAILRYVPNDNIIPLIENFNWTVKIVE